MENLDENSLWEVVLTELQLSVSSANFQTWFKGKTRLLGLKNGTVEIGCVSPYTKNWIEERYFGQIKGIVDRLTGTSNTLVFAVDSAVVPKIKPRRKPESTVPLFEESDSPDFKKSLEAAGINPKFSFTNFIVGASNQLAYAVAKSIVAAPYEKYNPLLIFGGVGVGKTHLLNAIAYALVLRTAGAKVLCCSSETFTNEMVEAIQKRQTIDFRAKYRNVDFLLIDDIHFIAGRESTQEEFFHTFNHLYSRGRQLVFSCDRDPKELGNLQERLKNRFVGGMIAKIDPPDIELREAIILAKVRQLGISLTPDLVARLASSLGPSIREVEGALMRVAAVSSLTAREPDATLLDTVLGPPRQKEGEVEGVIERAAAFFSLTAADLKGSSRGKDHVLPRQITMYLLRKNLGLSFHEVARKLGGKDHTTAIYAVRKVERMVEAGGELASLVSGVGTKALSG